MAAPAQLLLLAWFWLTALASGNILFEGATIIAFDPSLEELKVLRNASLLVENDRIQRLSEGPMAGTIPSDVERIDANDKIISPGFINTHHHLWQTAFKTLGSNTTLGDYLQKFSEFSPAGQYFTPEDTYLGQLAGSLELISEGVTTVLDHAHGGFSDEGNLNAVNATFDSGLRTYFALSIHSIPNGYPIENQQALLESLAQDARFHAPDSRVSLGLSYDNFEKAPSSNISTLLDLTIKNKLSVVTTHYLGGPWGDTNSPRLLDRYGWLNASIPVIFSHACFIDTENADLLRSTGHYISTTPESELHYGHGHPKTYLIQDQASLGVDTHFTFSASMVQQARLWLQSLRERNYIDVLDEWKIARSSPMSVKQAFSLITRNGGLALRRDDLGVIREGAKADLVVFSTGSPALLGYSDPIAAIILHSHAGDIEHVLIGGEFVKRNGSLVHKDYADLRRRFKASAERIQRTWSEMAFEQLEGTFSGLSPYADTAQIDIQRGNGTGY